MIKEADEIGRKTLPVSPTKNELEIEGRTSEREVQKTNLREGEGWVEAVKAKYGNVLMCSNIH